MTTTDPTPSSTRLKATSAQLSIPSLAGIGLLAATIAIHTSELSGKIEETSYIGLGYVMLIAASIVAIVLLAQQDRRGWLLGAATCAATLIGFVLTRTTGLPGATGDIGNWSETIALWSIIAEGAFLLLAGYVLGTDRSSDR